MDIILSTANFEVDRQATIYGVYIYPKFYCVATGNPFISPEPFGSAWIVEPQERSDYMYENITGMLHAYCVLIWCCFCEQRLSMS